MLPAAGHITGGLPYCFGILLGVKREKVWGAFLAFLSISKLGLCIRDGDRLRFNPGAHTGDSLSPSPERGHGAVHLEKTSLPGTRM